MSDRDGALPFSTYVQFIDARSSQRFNYLRTYIQAFYSSAYDGSDSNEGGQAFHGMDDPDDLNPAYYRLEPADDIVVAGDAYAVADVGSEYVLYLPEGGSVTVDLSAASGTLTAAWYDPRSGDFSGESAVEGGASRDLDAPDSNDWVLWVH